MKYIISILLAMGLVGCGHGINGSPPKFDVTPEAQKYVDRFITEGSARGYNEAITHLVVKIVPSIVLYETDVESPEAKGLCVKNLDGYPTVLLDQYYWENTFEVSKEALIMHELGHCVLGRQHKNDLAYNSFWNKAVMSSIMNINFDVGVYQFFRSNYLDELFSNL